MYENALRAHRGQSLKENHEESAELYAEFSKIASENEYAWSYGKYHDAKVIGTIGKSNRMICSPCKTTRITSDPMTETLIFSRQTPS